MGRLISPFNREAKIKKQEVTRMNEVTISAAEYKELLEAQAGVRAFSRYVNMARYSVDREVCAAILGFELVEVGEDAGEG